MPPNEPEKHTRTVIRRNLVELPDLRLIVRSSGGVRELKLTMDPLVVGSSADCDAPVEDDLVSRRHCELRLTDEGAVLRDLGSKNGTFINEVRIREAILSPGAAATIGSTRLELRIAGAPVRVQLSLRPRFGEVFGGSVAMRALFAKLEAAAPSDETILLVGESGTGKELLARAIHEASPRREGPFVVVDCSAVAPTLIESELFGHVRGAFTGASESRAGLLEQAHGGTLFIDELGELPVAMQPKLLRALETRQVRRVGDTAWKSFDARVIAATHRDLLGKIAEGTFREDLYYRIAVVVALVPPLRDRRDDIPLLVERFLAERRPPGSLDDLPANTLDMLMQHRWPGNVRELRNAVARLVLFPGPVEDAIGSGGEDQTRRGLFQLSLREARALAVEQFEREYLTRKLREHGGKVSAAADAMGVSRQLVYRLLASHGIDPNEL